MAKILLLIFQPRTLNGNDFFWQKCNVVLGQIMRENFGKLCFFNVELSNYADFF
jgi:hypothetical protein